MNIVWGRSGEDRIAEMWSNHFSQLYNCDEDGGFKKLFHDKMNEENPNLSNSAYVIIIVQELIDCVRKQKVGTTILHGQLWTAFLRFFWSDCLE